MNLVLFGFKGCGKTHFGKLLSLKLKRPFVDIDDLISELYQQQSGKKLKAREIYSTIGNRPFRELEKRAVISLQSVKNTIIALGGGTVLDPENLEIIKKIGALVYLKADPSKLKKRIFKDEIPSFLNEDDPEGSFLKMVQEREPIYQSIHGNVVDTELLDEAGVLAALSSILLLEDKPNGF